MIKGVNSLKLVVISILAIGLLVSGCSKSSNGDASISEASKVSVIVSAPVASPIIRAAATPTPKESTAAELLTKSKELKDAGMPRSARDPLTELIRVYPGTPEAETAQTLMDELNALMKEEDAATQKKVKEDEEAKKKAADNKKAEIQKKLNSMRIETDEVRGFTVYQDPASAEFGKGNSLFVYIVKDEDGYYGLRLRIQYANDTWLFVKNYVFKVDDNPVYELKVPYDKVIRDNNTNGVWEVYDSWIEKVPSPDIIDQLRAIAQSDKTILRFEGKTHQLDIIISASEKKMLTNMLNFFDEIDSLQ